jgi:hypothetical protein
VRVLSAPWLIMIPGAALIELHPFDALSVLFAGQRPA